MIKTSPFIHENFAKNNKFREISISFDNLLNAVFYSILITYQPNKIDYNFNHPIIAKTIIDMYTLGDTVNKQLNKLCVTLDMTIFLCIDRIHIKCFGNTLVRTRNHMIFYQYNDNYIPLIQLPGNHLLTFQQIQFIFHKSGKIQSSLRSIHFNKIQEKIIKHKLETKYSTGKKKSKQDLFEEIFFLEN